MSNLQIELNNISSLKDINELNDLLKKMCHSLSIRSRCLHI